MQIRPSPGEHDVLDADQAQRAIRLRLVDQRLRLVSVEDSVLDAVHLDVVNAHRSHIRAADTGRTLDPALGDRDVHIQVFLRRAAHALHEREIRGRILRLRSRSLLTVVREGDRRTRSERGSDDELYQILLHEESPIGLYAMNLGPTRGPSLEAG